MGNLKRDNASEVTEFIFIGFSQQPQIQAAFFLGLLIFYLITTFGNSLIVVVVRWDSQLHAAMYFFLSNLSFLDICYSTSWEPYVLAQCFRDFPTISYTGCYVQMTTSLFLGMTESLLLAVMAYDRFVAISNPLRYTLIMNNRVCVQLALGTWVSAFLVAVTPIVVIPAHYCGHNVINHFNCEIQALQKLVYSDAPVSLILSLIISVFTLPLPFTFILISYFFIVVAVLRIHSVGARLKAFSTCGSHLTVVTIFYGTAIFMYLTPQSKESQEEDKVFSIFYGAVTPMLNPLIYTLRNKDVKGSLRKLVKGNENS
ncbi:PREDICTED: olfactory receptor 13H1-like [Ceratotherium simum simum]|uniref:Olfactory receptor n=1 Tax=Ceratotherium simum simum TaxID=73337 RepID=A0ABM0HZU1_CERSS|nr:PREDICTED: olfactory receptor 13H1-like [Ceratotherium simum simum]